MRTICSAATQARRYRELVLEQGGSRPGRQMVRDFLGRDEEFSAFTNWLNEEFEAELAASNRSLIRRESGNSTLCYTCIAVCLEAPMLAIRLPEEIEKRLDALAKETGRTKSFYVREAILEQLDDLEDYYLAEKALQEIRSGKVKTIPLEEIMKRYGLED